MAEISYRDVVNTALAEVGYQGESKNSKYTRDLDSVNWYNYPKANACTWCAIFYDWCIWKNKGGLTDEQARQIVCEPADHNANSGAGCTQKAQMYKSAGRWISKPSEATTGDQIFFKRSDGAIYHTGIIVDWDNNGFYTVEGSTGGAKVLKHFYSYNDSKIAGFGRPDWYKYQEASKPSEPEKPKEESGKQYTVRVNSYLRIRSTPNGTIVGKLYNGDKVTVYEKKNGWGRIGSNKWVYMEYLK